MKALLIVGVLFQYHQSYVLIVPAIYTVSAVILTERSAMKKQADLPFENCCRYKFMNVSGGQCFFTLLIWALDRLPPPIGDGSFDVHLQAITTNFWVVIALERCLNFRDFIFYLATANLAVDGAVFVHKRQISDRSPLAKEVVSRENTSENDAIRTSPLLVLFPAWLPHCPYRPLRPFGSPFQGIRASFR